MVNVNFVAHKWHALTMRDGTHLSEYGTTPPGKVRGAFTAGGVSPTGDAGSASPPGVVGASVAMERSMRARLGVGFGASLPDGASVSLPPLAPTTGEAAAAASTTVSAGATLLPAAGAAAGG